QSPRCPAQVHRVPLQGAGNPAAMRLSDHQLVMAAFEGELGSAEFEALQRRLKEEPELLALYREHALLHHSLTEEFEGRQSLGEGIPSVVRGPRWLFPLIAFTVIL